MKINLEVPEYNSNTIVKYNWETGFDIEVKHENNVVIYFDSK